MREQDLINKLNHKVIGEKMEFHKGKKVNIPVNNKMKKVDEDDNIFNWEDKIIREPIRNSTCDDCKKLVCCSCAPNKDTCDNDTNEVDLKIDKDYIREIAKKAVDEFEKNGITLYETNNKELTLTFDDIELTRPVKDFQISKNDFKFKLYPKDIDSFWLHFNVKSWWTNKIFLTEKSKNGRSNFCLWDRDKYSLAIIKFDLIQKENEEPFIDVELKKL